MSAYDSALTYIAQNKLRWTDPAVSIRCLLVTDDYVFNAVHRYVADVREYEIAGESYQRRDIEGRTISSPINHSVQLRATPVLFPALDVPFSGVIIYARGGHDDSTPGDDVLLLFQGFEQVTPGGSAVQLEFTLSALTLYTDD